MTVLPQGHRGRGRPRNTWKRDLERECGQRALGSAGRKWRRQNKTEESGDKWYVAYDTLGVTRHKAITSDRKIMSRL